MISTVERDSVDRASNDGTSQRRLEQVLLESEERFGRLVEAAKDYAIFMTDAEGRVSTWNEGAKLVFRYEEGEILGEDGSVLFTPEDREGAAPSGNCRRPEPKAAPKTSAGTCARTDRDSGPAASSGLC